MIIATQNKLKCTLLAVVLSGLALSVPSANRKVLIKKRRGVITDSVMPSRVKSDTICRMNVYFGQTVSDKVRIHGVPTLQVDSTTVAFGGDLRLTAEDEIQITGDMEVEVGGELLIRSSGQNRIRFTYNNMGYRSSRKVDTSSQ